LTIWHQNDIWIGCHVLTLGAAAQIIDPNSNTINAETYVHFMLKSE
jgi:hypothetical protein